MEALAERRVATSILSLEDVAPASPVVHLAEILRVVCNLYGVTKGDVLSSRRQKEIVDARHVYFWIARKFTTCSFPLIGRHCGNKDHSTVMHGARKVDLLFPEYQLRIVEALDRLNIQYEVAA